MPLQPSAPAIRRFARRWAAELHGATSPAMTDSEVEDLLARLTAQVVSAVASTPFQLEPAREAGAALIDAHYRGDDVLGCTLKLLGSAFRGEIGVMLDDHGEPGERLPELLAAVAEGYTAALLRTVLDEQELTQRAALAAAHAADARRRESDARFAAVFAGAAVGIGTVDMHGVVMEVNAALADMLGVPADEIRGRPIADVIGRENLGPAYAEFEKLRLGLLDGFRIETAHGRADGRTTWIDLSMTAVRGDGGEPAFLIGVGVDITERRKLADRLWHEARHDSLTGLPNRKLYLDRLHAAAEPIGLCFLDLDGFHGINDSMGHDVGDRVLCAVANRLRTELEPHGCLVAHLGGDEFIALIENCTSPYAVGRTAERMLAALRRPISVDGSEITVSGSIGVVHSLAAGSDQEHLMQAAHIALSAAKAKGTGGWEMYDPTRGEQAVVRHSLAMAMPSALSRGEFFLRYQPIVDLATGQVQGLEALARWQHPRLGLVPPGRFIPIAEETGYIVALGRWALSTACVVARRWLDETACSDLYVSVNVAAAQLREPAFVTDVHAALDNAGLPPGNLQLELTETAVPQDTHEAVRALHELAAAGVRLAIDDFGTGYSNLAHLGQLPVHQLKIDRSLVTAGPDGRANGSQDKIVAATISLAHSLGLDVTAEGVETAADADRLRLLNCNNAQGWFYGREITAADLSNLARRRRADTG